jgi:hypothetical protein
MANANGNAANGERQRDANDNGRQRETPPMANVNGTPTTTNVNGTSTVRQRRRTSLEHHIILPTPFPPDTKRMIIPLSNDISTSIIAIS